MFEIKNPLPTIKEHSIRQTLSNKIKRKLKTSLSEYDVILTEEADFLIKEFSERCDVDLQLARLIISSVFEEIKRNMMNCKMVRISWFGTFSITKSAIAKKKKDSYLTNYRVVPIFSDVNFFRILMKEYAKLKEENLV